MAVIPPLSRKSLRRKPQAKDGDGLILYLPPVDPKAISAEMLYPVAGPAPRFRSSGAGLRRFPQAPPVRPPAVPSGAAGGQCGSPLNEVCGSFLAP